MSNIKKFDVFINSKNKIEESFFNAGETVEPVDKVYLKMSNDYITNGDTVIDDAGNEFKVEEMIKEITKYHTMSNSIHYYVWGSEQKVPYYNGNKKNFLNANFLKKVNK